MQSKVQDLVLTPNGKTVVAAADMMVVSWDLATGKILSQLKVRTWMMPSKACFSRGSLSSTRCMD